MTLRTDLDARFESMLGDMERLSDRLRRDPVTLQDPYVRESFDLIFRSLAAIVGGFADVADHVAALEARLGD